MNKATNVFCIINFPTDRKSAPLKVLDKDALTKLAKFGSFYTILHDRYSDFEGDETIHRHLLIIGVDSKPTAVWLEVLSLIFDVPKNCISIESVTNKRKCGRYLVHRDNPEKFQFPPEEVQTNNLKQFQEWLKGGSVTPNALMTFKGSYTDFLQEFGVENTKRYWSVCEKVQADKRKAEHDAYQVAHAEQVLYRANEWLKMLQALETAILAKRPQPGSSTWEVRKHLRLVIDDIKSQLSGLLGEVIIDDKKDDKDGK